VPNNSLLDQLPNGGAVIAIIVVTWLYLSAIKELMAQFIGESRDSRKEYREHITQIMQLGLTAHEETRAAIRMLAEVATRDTRKP
jgi:uncharacterized protein Yka (UPF0111/DUF47 family)